MLIDWTGEFDVWYDRLIALAERGDARARGTVAVVDAQLGVLQGLAGEPRADGATLRRVAQARKHQVWRLSHPYDPERAIRLIVWFPPEQPDHAVIVLFGADKARMGDVFYNSVGTRADAAIETYLRRTRNEGDTR
ncbi:MAG: hypothetical protein LBQ06_06350 [Frankiaceae bacterium]|nr:hypothetical protein [Frankiaceae bacterium]